MNKYDLRLNASKVSGKKKSCTGKYRHDIKNKAKIAALLINIKMIDKKQVVEYPCAFCNGWHVGRKMSYKELLSYT